MSEDVSREEIAALLARESMSEEMIIEQATDRFKEQLESGFYRDRNGKSIVVKEGMNKEQINTVVSALEAEPCEDAISRKQACALALNSIDNSITPNDIMRMPIVQPIRPRGHWIWSTSLCVWVCSLCDWENAEEVGKTNFCPSCGADMREGNDGD